MKIPNWVAATFYTFLLIGMGQSLYIDITQGTSTFVRVIDMIAVTMWFLIATITTVLAIRRPNAPYVYLWRKRK